MGEIDGIVYLSSRWLRRQPLWLVQDVFLVLGFAILMYVWGGMNGLRNVFVAYFISGAWGMGVNMIAQSIGWDKQNRVMDMFIASPVRPWHYVIGYFVPGLAFILVDLVILLPFIAYLNAWNILGASLIAVLPLILMSTLLGLAIVMRIKKATNISAITNPLQMLLVILPPVFYPAQVIPLNIRYFVLLIPTAAGAELARQLAGLSSWHNLWYPSLVLVSWVVVGIISSAKTVKWGME